MAKANKRKIKTVQHSNQVKRSSASALSHARDGQRRTPRARAAVWQTKFLTALHATGSVTKACHAAHVQRSTAYRARIAAENGRAKRNEDQATDGMTAPAWVLYDDFAARWDAALDAAVDALEDEARRRAMDGIDRPITYQGEITGTYKEYSNPLLITLLKAHRPEKYRERFEHSGPGGKPLTTVAVVTADELSHARAEVAAWEKQMFGQVAEVARDPQDRE